jgi:hypothetical protein
MGIRRRNLGHGQRADLLELQRRIPVETSMLRRNLARTIGEPPRGVGQYGFEASFNKRKGRSRLSFAQWSCPLSHAVSH